MAALTLCFVAFDVGIVQGVIGDIHRPAAPRLGTGQMLVLQSFDKPTMRYPLLF
jgi:hypothetical protein